MLNNHYANGFSYIIIMRCLVYAVCSVQTNNSHWDAQLAVYIMFTAHYS